MTRATYVVIVCAMSFVVSTSFAGQTRELPVPPQLIPVQEFDAPPEVEFPEIPRATPAPEVLSEEELKRAEALLPLLEGQQELYIIAEFNHLGKPVVPVLVKALKMPGPRVRYNAIETLSMIKDPRAVPHLIEVAKDINEMTRIRAHALRVAVKLSPSEMAPVLQALVKDESDTMRRTVAFEARNVRRPEIPPILVELLADSKRYVSVTALESFWRLTRHVGEPHDWQGSTHEQRKEWAQEWKAWWEETLKKRRQPAPKKEGSAPVS